MTELALDDAGGMLELCTHLGDDPVDHFPCGVDFVALARLAHDGPELVFLAEGGLAFSANIALIGQNRKALTTDKKSMLVQCKDYINYIAHCRATR